MLTRRCEKMYVEPGSHRSSALITLLGIQNPIMPVTVQDQIRLWEMEKHRVKSEEGLVLSSSEVFPLTCPLLDRLYLQRLFLRWRLRSCPQVRAGSRGRAVVQ